MAQDPVLLDLAVHKFERIPGTSQVRIKEVNPYLRLSRRDHPPLYIQKGRVFPENGPEVPKAELPEWFWQEIAKITSQGLTEVGWDHSPAPRAPKKATSMLREDSPIPIEKPPPSAKKKEKWKCDQCDAEPMELTKKGIHLAFHKRMSNREARRNGRSSTDSVVPDGNS